MNDNTKAPGWYTAVAVIALIWNLLGLMAFAMQMLMTPEMIAQMPEDQQAMMNAMPGWVTAAFGVATIGGSLGALMMLLKKHIAHLLFIISLAGVLVQQYWGFVVMDGLSVYTPFQVAMTTGVLVFGIILILLTRKAKANGWSS